MEFMEFMGFMGFIWDLWDYGIYLGFMGFIWDLFGIYKIYSKGVRNFFSDLPPVVSFHMVVSFVAWFHCEA